MISKVYILAPNCIIVKGYLRSSLLDLQKKTIQLIEHSSAKIISKPIPPDKITSLSKVDAAFVKDLITRDVLILIPKSQIKLLPKISTQFHNITEINNVIIELSVLTYSFLSKIEKSLNDLGCKFVELRLAQDIGVEKLKLFLKKISLTTVEGISIYAEFKTNQNYLDILDLNNKIPEIYSIYFYNVPNQLYSELKKSCLPNIILLRNQTINETNCGNISPEYFTVNIPTFTEAVNYNTCLNCKISLKQNGDIKQCPSMEKSFGNIKKTSFDQVIKEKNFLKFGRIKKDDIKVCKDCEFRYVCTDCRAYLEIPNDEYSKPLKCGYNPYTGEWLEWSLLSSKQKAISHYKLEHLITN